MEHVEELLREYGEVDRLIRVANFEEHVKERGHQVRFSEVLEIQSNLRETEYFYNEGHFEGEPGRGAPIIMLGYTANRRFLCIPIEPTTTKGTWRVLTAFEPDNPYYQVCIVNTAKVSHGRAAQTKPAHQSDRYHRLQDTTD